MTTAHPAHDNRILRKECAALDRAGFDMHLVAVADCDETQHGVSIHALPRRRTRLARMVRGPLDAWARLKQIQPDMIQVHDPELIPMAIVWRLRYRRPAVFDAHEDLPKQMSGKPYIPRFARPVFAILAKLLEGAADHFLDAIVAATPSISRNFHNQSIALVQNFPLLTDYFRPTPYPVGLATNFSYVGGIALARGGLEMVESVATSEQNLRLTLAGSATNEMRDLMQADNSGRITYLGLLPAEKVPKLVGESSAGLVLFHPLPNHMECQPTKLFEYMAAARPFIASEFKAWRELLESFDCGYFVDPLQIDSIRTVMDRISTHPEEAMEKGLRGRQALVEHFTFENESQRLVEMTTMLLRS